jgi:hypothetical protein
MRKIAVLAASAVVVAAGSAVAFGEQGFNRISEVLTGHKEVPVISTTGHGRFTATISDDQSEIRYSLKYEGLEGEITQSHIHFGPPNNTGGIAMFLCSNLANPPAGTPACPLPSGEVEGVLTAASVIGPVGQGIEVGNLEEVIAAIRAGKTYVNIHTTKWPAGEIRSQIDHDSRHH